MHSGAQDSETARGSPRHNFTPTQRKITTALLTPFSRSTSLCQREISRGRLVVKC